MPTSPISELIGGEPEENAKEIKELLNGKKSAFRNVVVLNSAAALVATGNADSLEEGAEKSILSIDTGQAMKKLEMLIDISNNS
jgi:anthranilate phosphoribosyltransferase